MNSNTVSMKLVIMIGTMLSAVILVASTVPSLVPRTAFAQQAGSANENLADNLVKDNSVKVDPTIQLSTEVDTNVNVDDAVGVSDGCADISDNDKVKQVNEQEADQKVYKNNDVGAGGVVVEPSIQLSTQTATNVNKDNDVYIILGCDEGDVKISDNDKVKQVNDQAANQEALSDSEVGAGGLLVSPAIQRADHAATNLNENNDRVVYINPPNLEEPSDTHHTTLNFLSNIAYMR
jgi:hypothetical protein